jgi:hypothetical protein
MDIRDIFVSKATKLFWRRLPAKQVAEGYTEQDIVNDQAYFLVRLKEMYLRTTRVALRKYYPMLHSFAAYSGQEVHSVSGPGQLRELGDRNLERLINLNTRLTDITAYKGGDVDLLVGLYSIPGQDAGKVLIDTLSSVASLAGIVAGQAMQIANLVKTGVEGMLGLDEATLQLGVRDTFFPKNPFRSGHYVAVNASPAQVNLDQLWLRGGQLVKGPDPFRSRPYDDFDYMVLEIEHREYRDDWPRLPGLVELNDKFAQVMGDKGLKVPQKREKLRDLWPEFQNVLDASSFLVQPDRQRIAKSVGDDLSRRLTAVESQNPFETRGWDVASTRQIDPEQFDMVDVEDTFDPRDAESIRMANYALNNSPF